MTIVSLMLFLLITGLGAGFLAGLLGIGGGVVLVPALRYLFSFYYESMSVMHMAVGTSLAIIVPTGLSSAWAHYRHGHIDWALWRQIGAGIIVGVVIGTWTAAGMSGRTLALIFACVLVILSLLMMTKKPVGRIVYTRSSADIDISSAGAGGDAHMDNRYPGRVRCGFAGVVIGAVSTLIGIGGATLSVPFMVLHHVLAHKAVGTAAALGLVIAVPAALGFIMIGREAVPQAPYSLGYVNYMAWLCIAPASVLAAPLGAALSKRLPVDILRRAFSVFLLVVAARMIYNIFHG